MQIVSDYFKRHEEQAFIAKAFLMILLIILVREYLSGLLSLLFILFPVVFLVYIRFQAAAEGISPYDLLKEHITFIPIMRAEGDRKTEVVPWVTYGIILVNVLIFYLYEAAPWGDIEFIVNNLIFLPREPNLWNCVVSAFSSMFLHARSGHLWGNMIFLWMLGTAVERRIGYSHFALLYLITGLFGGVAFVLSAFIATGEAGHAMGASGAIAGIMGIFAVRCYFKSMIFPIPILGIFSLILPISLKVRLNSLVIIGLFFLADLSGGIGQLSGESASMVGHWAHLGGMISGMILAGFLKLGEGAVEERHLEIGIKAASSKIGFGSGEQSLRQVLEHNPDNVEALLALARIKSKFGTSNEGGELYAKAIGLMAAVNPDEAATIYSEYRKVYQKALPPDILMSLAGVFQRRMELDNASRCLESVIATQPIAPELRLKALAQHAILLDKQGFEDGARRQYETLIREFPHSELALRAYARLGLKPPAHTAEPRPEAQSVPTVRAGDGKLSSSAAVTCPACSSTMQKRRANSGAHSGKLFWVCVGYPQCRGVVPVNETASPIF